jgi:hypothetical protein
MKRIRTRLMVTLSLALLLSSMLPSSVAAWDGTCDVGQICIWRDRDFVGPDAAQTGDLIQYAGTYPGNPSPINDSASSTWNRYAALDVVFYHEFNHQGTTFCNDSQLAYSWVGLFSNDAFSSHDVKGNDIWC